MKRGSKKHRRMMKDAAKATPIFRHIGTSKWTKEEQTKHYCRGLGKFGAASEVKVLMKDGVAIEEE